MNTEETPEKPKGTNALTLDQRAAYTLHYQKSGQRTRLIFRGVRHRRGSGPQECDIIVCRRHIIRRLRKLVQFILHNFC
jgi:hypothetical protein